MAWLVLSCIVFRTITFLCFIDLAFFKYLLQNWLVAERIKEGN